MEDIEVVVVHLDTGDKAELLEALRSLGDTDEALSGRLGRDELWAEAEGFDSNLDYVMDKVEKSQLHGQDMVKFFMGETFSTPPYRCGYKYETSMQGDKVRAIALIWKKY